MSRSARMETLLRLRSLAETAARRRLAQSSAELQRREAQCEQLQSYDREYAASWIERGAQGIDGAHIARFGLFRASLSATLATQQHAVQAGREQVSLRASQWADMRAREKVFEELAQRARRDEERERERREQRLADDNWLAGQSARKQ
jgi:flagellar export protein FliJ